MDKLKDFINKEIEPYLAGQYNTQSVKDAIDHKVADFINNRLTWKIEVNNSPEFLASRSFSMDIIPLIDGKPINLKTDE